MLTDPGGNPASKLTPPLDAPAEEPLATAPLVAPLPAAPLAETVPEVLMPPLLAPLPETVPEALVPPPLAPLPETVPEALVPLVAPVPKVLVVPLPTWPAAALEPEACPTLPLALPELDWGAGLPDPQATRGNHRRTYVADFMARSPTWSLTGHSYSRIASRESAYTRTREPRAHRRWGTRPARSRPRCEPASADPRRGGRSRRRRAGVRAPKPPPRPFRSRLRDTNRHPPGARKRSAARAFARSVLEVPVPQDRPPDSRPHRRARRPSSIPPGLVNALPLHRTRARRRRALPRRPSAHSGASGRRAPHRRSRHQERHRRPPSTATHPPQPCSCRSWRPPS